MKLCSLLKNVDYTYTTCRMLDTEINNITDNSEFVGNGDIFIAVRGMEYDGHNYIQNAQRNGARIIICEKIPDIRKSDDCDFVVCENTRRALTQIWGNYYDNPQRKLKLIAVTGTNGKTTVTYMLKKIFEHCGHKVGIIGTVKYIIGGDEYVSELTTPDPSCFYRLLSEMVDKNTEYVFVEASSHSLALDKLCICNFEVGILTNITTDHMDFHLNYENYLTAKSKLFMMSETAVLNRDDQASEKIKGVCSSPYFYSAENRESDFFADNIVQKGLDGVEYDYICKKDNRVVRVSLGLPALFSVYNSLCAIACAHICKISPEDSAKALSDMQCVRGRMEKIEFNDVILPCKIIIDFAHTPDALQNVLSAVRRVKKENGKLIVVFGCGGNRDRSKRSEMGRIASRFADLAVITSDNVRNEKASDIIRDIMRGIDAEMRYVIIEERKKAIEFALEYARQNDIIVLAGKGHEEYEIIGNEKKPFSEREIIHNYLKKS